MSVFTVSAWSASSVNGGGYEAYRAGDGVYSVGAGYRWAAASSGAAWLKADLGTAKTATYYVVGPGQFASSQDPSGWTFEGSNDDFATAGVVLDTKSSVTFSNQAIRYVIASPGSYRYYRLNITGTSGGVASVSELQIGDNGAHRTFEPGIPDAVADATNYNLGVVWSPLVDGNVTYLRYYECSAANGTTTLRLYGAGGTVLASATHTAVTGASGWREVSITPVAVTAGTQYMAASQLPGGAFGRFANGANPFLGVSFYGTIKVESSTTATYNSVTGNGRYNGGGSAMPTGVTTNSGYAVGVVFEESSGLTGSVAGTSPAAVGSLTGTVATTGTLAGTSPSGVGSLAGTAPTTGTVAATSPSGVGSFTGTTDNTTTGSIAGTSPSGTGAIVGTAPTTGTLAGTSPVGVGSLNGDVPAALTGTIAGTSPSGSGSLTGVVTLPGATTGTIAGSSPSGVGSLVADTGSALDPWTAGAHGDALLFLDAPAGVLEVVYAATPAPAAIVEVALQRASHQMPALTGVRAMDYPIETDVVGVPHVWVDGVDVTYFRDHPTKIGGWRDEAPFAWTSTTLTFPQVFHFEKRGVGDLAWMRPDAPVEVAIVRPDGSRLHRFTGQLTSDDPGVGSGRTECVWGVEGLLWQADHVHHDVPARLDPTDIGTLIPRELNGTPSRRFSAIKRVHTGIPERKRGSTGQTRWGYVTDLMSTAVREDGKQWTIEPTGPRSFALVLKDTTTVHWTITAGAPGVELDLSADNHERIDAVYASGVGPDGYAWSNIFFPDLLPYDPPNYPYSNPAQNVLLGSTDAGTLTGHAISDWQQRIRDLGYTSIAVDGVMGSSDIAAVRWIQRKRGIQVDGFLGPQTWAATWNVGAIGGDLSTVRLPMAWRPEVEKYLYGANGAVVGLNPVYDPSIIRHEIDVDFGAGVTKEQGREMAQRILERGMDPGVAGSLKLTTCPWEGSRWEINSGQNVLLKGFRGEDILMRIAAVDADPESLTVTLTVDSEFRDAMAVQQVLDRNRESKADPARRPGNPNKRSTLDQDMVTPFEGESPAGRLPKMALFGGLWTVWPIPVSEIGEVARMTFRTTGPASKFCLALFGKPVTANQVDSLVPAPLTDSQPWQDHEELLLDKYGWIDTWGKDGQASGYSPGQEGSHALTGKLTDDAGFPYVSQKAPWVWVAMWSPNSCFIEGRIYPSPVQ